MVRDQYQPKPEDSKVSTKPSYKINFSIDLAEIGEKGYFLCPKCGVKISPEDRTESVYKVVEIKPTKDGNDGKYLVLCNCGTCIKIDTPFEILEKEVDDLRKGLNMLRLVRGDKNIMKLLMILNKTSEPTTTEFLLKTSELDLNSAQKYLETLENNDLIKNLPYRSYQITGLGRIIMGYVTKQKKLF
jgi:predicted transcriptional regulator